MTDITKIDWRRMAKPQPDGYDSQVTLECARQNGYVRRPPGVNRTVLHGRIAVRPMEAETEVDNWCEQGPLDHPNLDRAVGFLERWPEGLHQFDQLMDTIYPIEKVRISPEAFPNTTTASSPILTGSASHSEARRFGSMYTTIYDPIGTAQAFVHETAHQKLRALGIGVESASRFLTKQPDKLLESPVRKDKLRPITAVLHATYSWLYITQFDVKLLSHALTEDPIVARLFCHYLRRNIPPLLQGVETFREHVGIEDEDARDFFNAIFEWANDVLTTGMQLLAGFESSEPSPDYIALTD
jgi:hypothetical protein